MPVTHFNRKSAHLLPPCWHDQYGEAQIWFAKSAEGDLVESIPDGYEVYEKGL